MSVGSTPSIKTRTIGLIALGLVLIFLSQAVNMYLINTFGQYYQIRDAFTLQQGEKETHVTHVSEADVILLIYNVTINTYKEGRVKIRVSFIGTEGMIINSSSMEMSSISGSLTGKINVDGYLDKVVVTVEGDEWSSAWGTVILKYSRIQPIQIVASLASPVIAMIGLTVFGYGLINYALSKKMGCVRKSVSFLD